MKQIIGAIRRTNYGAVAALFLLTAVVIALPARKAHAAGLLYRSLQLTSSQPSGVSTAGPGGVAAGPGEASNGDKVGHTYVFESPTGGNLGGLKIQYCTGPFNYLAFDDGSGSCTGPTAFSSTAATAVTIDTFTNQTNFNSNTIAATDTGYVRDASSTANELILTKASSPLSVAAGGFVRVTLTATGSVYFVNPSTVGTFFAHLETYDTSAHATGADNTNAPIDEGTVTSSTANTISINTRVQETLNFSVEGEDDPVGAAGPSTAEGATCAALGVNGAINIGDATNSYALAANRTYDGYSYFRLATNSSKGARVLYAGGTLTSTAGDNIDPVATTATAPAAGTEQFGLGFASDFTSTNGDNDVQATINSNTGSNNDLTGVAAYVAGDKDSNGSNVALGTYAYDTTSNGAPKLIASSTSVVKCDTAAIRYIADISNDTPAGLYSTKVSYIAVPSY